LLIEICSSSSFQVFRFITPKAHTLLHSPNTRKLQTHGFCS
jgi:hypothetical protein